MINNNDALINCINNNGGNSNSTSVDDVSNNDTNMNQGEILRKLRQLELQDEAERRQQQEQEQDESIIRNENGKDNDEELDDETVDTEITESKHVLLSSGKKVLLYDSYLYHQRYYDDLKHIDYNYINYTIPPTTISSSYHQKDKVNETCIKTKTTPSITSTSIPPSPQNNILILQDKLLGKGGFCWDAAFILAEYILHTLCYSGNCLSSCSSTRTKNDNIIIPASVLTTTTNDTNQQQQQQQQRNYRIVELGAGTGLCSILLAKGLQQQHSILVQQNCSYDITVTDLGKVVPLVQQNVIMNCNNNNYFETLVQQEKEQDPKTDTNMYSGSFVDYQEYFSSKSKTGINTSTLSSSSSLPLVNNDNASHVNIHASELEWGCFEQEKQHGTFDIIVGADVVASIYDPILLAQTIYRLCHNSNTIVYISFKERLSTIHRQFEIEIHTLFTTITIVQPPFYYISNNSSSTNILSDDGTNAATNKIPIPMRNYNPAVHILIASGAKK